MFASIFNFFCTLWFRYVETLSFGSTYFSFSDFRNPFIVVYKKPEDAQRYYLSDVAGVTDRAILDMRYGTNLSFVSDDNIIYLEAETLDKNSNIVYGGPHVSLKLSRDLHGLFYDNNSIVFDGVFDGFRFTENGSIGGGVNYNLFLHNDKIGKSINIVIGVYTAGVGRMREVKKPLFDPTTNTVHISTVMGCDTLYCTTDFKTSSSVSKLSSTPKSRERKRVVITRSNMLNILKALKKNGAEFGLIPSDWYLTSIMLQVEVEEDAGYGCINGTVSDLSFSILSVK